MSLDDNKRKEYAVSIKLEAAYLHFSAHEAIICETEPAELVVLMGVHPSIIKHQVRPEVLQHTWDHLCYCSAATTDSASH